MTADLGLANAIVGISYPSKTSKHVRPLPRRCRSNLPWPFQAGLFVVTVSVIASGGTAFAFLQSIPLHAPHSLAIWSPCSRRPLIIIARRRCIPFSIHTRMQCAAQNAAAVGRHQLLPNILLAYTSPRRSSCRSCYGPSCSTSCSTCSSHRTRTRTHAHIRSPGNHALPPPKSRLLFLSLSASFASF